MSKELWYYTQGSQQQGPVSFQQLKALAASAKLRPEDLVWSTGMEAWAPARAVAGIFPEATFAPPVPPPLAQPPSAWLPAAEESPFVDQGRTLVARVVRRAHELDSRVAGSRLPHVRMISRLLELLQNGLSATVLDRLDRTSRQVGHVAYTVAALLFVLFYSVLAIKVDSVEVIFIALLGLLPLALVGHFTAVHFLDAGVRLLPKLPSRVSSRAMLDCTAVICVSASLIPLATGILLMIQKGNWAGASLSFAASALLVYVGALCLTPSSVNVEVTETAAAGEEALGLLSLASKMLLRLVPVVFGLGSLVAVGGALYFFILLITEQLLSPAYPVLGEWSALDLTLGALGLGIVPFLAYLVFVVLNLVAEVLRAVLGVPARLEGVREALGRSGSDL